MALISSYDMSQDQITLAESIDGNYVQIPYVKMVRGVSYIENNDYGFYVIS
jgi:hypothetical protein